jgi:hypothetical protein
MKMTSNTSEIVRPDNPLYSPEELKELIILTRYCLYNHNALCGAKAIRSELLSWDIRPLPSLSFIGRILRLNGLTYRRTGFY